MHRAVILAIDSGMRFDNDDFIKIARDMPRLGFHDEGIYSLAIKSGNISACRAMEFGFGRKPFIAKFPVMYLGGRDLCRQKGRIAVGTQFRWDGKNVTVTSFAADGESLTACAYKPEQREETEQVIDRMRDRKSKKFCPVLKRYRITREDLI